MRWRFAGLMGIAGVLCAAMVVLALSEARNLGHFAPFAFVAASVTAFALWPSLSFTKRVKAFGSGALVALLSHVPFNALLMLYGIGSETTWQVALEAFFPVILIGWIVAGIPEAVIGGIAGIAWREWEGR